MERKQNSTGLFGSPSLLVIFAVLFLTILTLLTLERARTGRDASLLAAEQTRAAYLADCEAEEILAALRAGDVPDGVRRDGDVYSYTCTISDSQTLEVSVRIGEDGDYTVLSRRRVSTPPGYLNEDIELWDGIPFFGE